MKKTILFTAVILATAAQVTAPIHLSLISRAAAATPSRLGDLTQFRNIVVDTAKIADSGNLDAAKARIKDLETSWDDAEPSLKPRDAAEWHLIDKAIDNALSALRARKPDAATCRQSLAQLLAVMDNSGSKV